MPMKNNIIIRGIGGFYDVLTSDKQEIRCKLRGRLRLTQDKVLVGDWVELVTNDDGTVSIEKILPRKNELMRPTIANIDQAIIVMALANPNPNLLLLDRLLVLVAAAGIKPIICINKTDLDDGQQLEDLLSLYQNTGYKIICTNTQDQASVMALKAVLLNNVSTFAGPSGVGKSSLLNVIEEGLGLAVGTISTKLKRGKHTTRSVELIALSDGGLVADTPGFSQLTLPKLEEAGLQEFFPEIWDVADGCKFRGCYHHKEPHCAVQAQVKSGEISLSRYNNYLALLEELKQVNSYN